MIELNERAVAAMRRPPPGDRIRIGLTADALERGLPSMLEDIRSRHPGTQLALHTDLSARLCDDVGHGRLDLAVFKRTPSNEAGAVIGTEPMAWFGSAGMGPLRGDAPVPLVLFAEGCAYRDAALRSLDRVGHGWRIACEVRSLSALLVAVNAGLGCTALPVRLGTGKAMGCEQRLPELAAIELALGIAEGCEQSAAHAIGALLARRCAEA
jgi:DNA-binding transcriptional LysR family regulator